MKKGMRRVIGLFFITLAAPLAWAEDPPDMEVNPVTGYIESVDSAAAENYKIRFIEDPGPGHNPTFALISGSSSKNPRLAIDGDGSSWVAWWLDGPSPEVFIRTRDPLTGTWSLPLLVSGAGEDALYPEIVHDGFSAWVAYEIRFDRWTSIGTVNIIDDIEPVGLRSVVGTTEFAGDRDVLIHAEDGKVWTTWVDSATEVGWSQYDAASGVWTATAYESYAGSDVAAARAAISAIVLGP